MTAINSPELQLLPIGDHLNIIFRCTADFSMDGLDTKLSVEYM